MRPVFVSFHTPDYIKPASRLANSLLRHDLEYKIVQIEPTSSWLGAIRQRPAFIKEMLMLYDGRPVVWLDADAEVVREPTELLEYHKSGNDFGCVFRHDKEPIGFTLYFNNTRGSHEFLDLWRVYHKSQPDWRGDIALSMTLMTIHSAYKAFTAARLSSKCGAIFDAPDMHPDQADIIQHQHSRIALKTKPRR